MKELVIGMWVDTNKSDFSENIYLKIRNILAGINEQLIGKFGGS